jgi:hypothetical protein
MLEDLIETQYFQLELPLSAGEVSNVFHYHRDQEKYWKMSNKPLRVYQKEKIVAEFSPWSDIVKDGTVKGVINKNSDGYAWFPTFLMHKRGLFKLYDSKFAYTDRGTIPTVGLEKEPENKAVTIGDIGEQEIAKYYNGQRGEWFDPKKDGIISELTYEVKTFQLNRKHQGFLVEQSQWGKLDGVDMLFFVQVPDRDEDQARAFLAINHKMGYHYVYENNQKLRCYPLTNCLFQFIIDKDKSKIMLEKSKQISKWRK